MAKDLFAPPTADELKQVAAAPSKDLFAPPSVDELKAHGIDPSEVPSSLGQDAKDLGMGVGQGLTLGFGDELLGAAQAGKDVVAGDTKLSDILSAYRKHQKENEKAVEDAKERSPWLTKGGEVAGSILPAILTMGGSAEAQGALAAAEAAGDIGATALAKKALLQQAVKSGAKIGALAGAGGSKGTFEGDPSSIIKDSAFGAGLGALMPIAGNQASKGAGMVSDALADSPLAQKLSYLWDSVKNKGQNYSGKEAGEMIEKELKDTSGSITNQLLDPLKQSSQMYGDALDTASKNGAKIGSDPELLKKLAAARNLIAGKAESDPSAPVQQKLVKQIFDSESATMSPEMAEQSSQIFDPNSVSFKTQTSSSTIPVGQMRTGAPNLNEATSGRGGLTQEMENLLTKHGSQAFDSSAVAYKTQAMSPSEAKQLQLALRALSNKSAYADTNVIGDAEKALTPAIRDALPPGELDKINSIFGQARQAVEPLINKGQIDPEFQSKQISDINTDDLGGKINNYLQGLLSKTQEGNIQGDKSRSSLNDIIEHLRNVNEKNQIKFTDPDQIAQQAHDIGMKTAIRKGMVGEKTSDKVGLVSGLGDFVAGSPYRAVELGAKVARGADNMIESTKLPELSRNIYNATDDALRGAADKLNESGMPWLGKGLHSALDNKSVAAKNAALFTIMQNPNARKAVFGADDNVTEDQK